MIIQTKYNYCFIDLIYYILANVPGVARIRQKTAEITESLKIKIKYREKF